MTLLLSPALKGEQSHSSAWIDDLAHAEYGDRILHVDKDVVQTSLARANRAYGRKFPNKQQCPLAKFRPFSSIALVSRSVSRYALTGSIFPSLLNRTIQQ